MTHAAARSLFGARQYTRPSRFIDEIPPEHCEIKVSVSCGRPFLAGSRGSRGSKSGSGGMGGSGSGAAGGYGGGVQAGGRIATARFKIGDGDEHANFGEGVVIGVEPGNMIAVRFTADGSERKFIADYAPITKRVGGGA